MKIGFLKGFRIAFKDTVVVGPTPNTVVETNDDGVIDESLIPKTGPWEAGAGVDSIKQRDKGSAGDYSLSFGESGSAAYTGVAFNVPNDTAASIAGGFPDFGKFLTSITKTSSQSSVGIYSPRPDTNCAIEVHAFIRDGIKKWYHIYRFCIYSDITGQDISFSNIIDEMIHEDPGTEDYVLTIDQAFASSNYVQANWNIPPVTGSATLFLKTNVSENL